MGNQVIKRKSVRQEGARVLHRSAGYSLLELVVVVVIMLITTAIALPLVQNATAAYRLHSAVNAITGLIQTTRYQAMQNGYEYQLVMNSAAGTYQLQSDPGNSANCSGCTNLTGTGNSGPLWASSSQAKLSGNLTLLLHPGGKVDVMVSASPGTMPTTFTVTYGNLPAESVTVSAYGSITVSP